MEEMSCVYGINHKTRCMVSQEAEQEKNRFIIGTQDPRNDNEIHLLEFNEDECDISSIIFKHPGEVWSITAHPYLSDMIFTTYKIPNSQTMETSLWKMNTVDVTENTVTEYKLDNMATFNSNYKIKKIICEPTESATKLATLEDNTISVWDINNITNTSESIRQYTIPSNQYNDKIQLTAGVWSPHSNDIFVTTNNENVFTWDCRKDGVGMKIENAHEMLINDIDYNPNKPYFIATAGNDCNVKLWDIRLPKEPLKIISDHSHWVWNVKFNHYHDQLLITSSSDCQVNLQSAVSVSSSAKFLEEKSIIITDEKSDFDDKTSMDDSITYNKYEQELFYTGTGSSHPVDGIVSTYDQHEDSVYAITWSNSDPWIFGSLSYDGRFVINIVPSEEKYKIFNITCS
ncbi:WD40 repeat-like protein [Piromyces finnis]|uniref:WD40 repeat-like protein n=1 Tax=Piromyces finnis TaxID=1754191 RepID=A0A1Y1VB76_9FUNG|nr:WD40 repeat-like protein [Piromyces finnis]|eukprot:ORX51811.1 WD40 repeat-like protein [Piromyces finnis]